MVHSVDDFNDPDTQIIFKAFSHLLKENGMVFFSGYTDYMISSHKPYLLVSKLCPDTTFYGFRNMHETNLLNWKRLISLCSNTDMQNVYYEEFNRDPLFVKLNSWEDYVSKLLFVNRIRRFLWKSRTIKKIHLALNSYIASYLMKRENYYAKITGIRGINFFCISKKIKY